MTQVPKTLGNEIGDALNELIRQSDAFRNWNSPEIQAIAHEIEKLKKVDARRAFGLLGALSAICGRADDVSVYYSKAAYLPDLQATKLEFYLSFCNVGLYSKAREIGSWLLDPKRGFYPAYWKRAACFGQIIEVATILPDAKRTYQDLSKEDFFVVEDAASVMRIRGFGDAEISSVLELMGEVQRKHGIMFAGYFGSSIQVVRPPEDEPYLYVTIPVSKSVEFVHAMNRDLIKLIVEKMPDGIFPGGLVMSFAKAELQELREAA